MTEEQMRIATAEIARLVCEVAGAKEPPSAEALKALAENAAAAIAAGLAKLSRAD